jgi:hypothetical protein
MWVFEWNFQLISFLKLYINNDHWQKTSLEKKILFAIDLI